jgi:hypothetical protein
MTPLLLVVGAVLLAILAVPVRPPDGRSASRTALLDLFPRRPAPESAGRRRRRPGPPAGSRAGGGGDRHHHPSSPMLSAGLAAGAGADRQGPSSSQLRRLLTFSAGAGAARQGLPSSQLRGLLTRLPGPDRTARRRRELEEAVPEVLDVLRATVAAGTTPRRALQAAAEGAPPPLAALLGQAIRAAELGAGAGLALTAAARVEGLTELQLAGEALDLAETTGAPPGPVLAGVAAAAADRVRARQARMAATAQARLSARVVAAMAPAFLVVFAVTSPSDVAFLLREPLGWATVAAAAAFETAGIFWTNHIVRGPTP